jgi:hypothetical protein
MMSDWFMYSIIGHCWVSSKNPTGEDELAQQALALLSPKWQQQSQQQLLSKSGIGNNDNSINTTTTGQLKLDYTTLASVLKLSRMTDRHYATAVQFLVERTGFVSYEALADVHSAQPLLYDTQGNHTIGVSSELMCTSLWHSDSVTCSINEYGVILPTTTAATSYDKWFAATAVVPIQADLSLDVLNSAITLSEKQNSAEVFSSDVIGAIVDLNWELHAEQYWTTELKQSIPITLALLAYYLLYFGVQYYSEPLNNIGTSVDDISTKALVSNACWHLLQVIISWCIVTTAAVHKLHVKATSDHDLMRRAFCLFAYYGWGLASTVILAPAHVQQLAVSNSVNMTTITAIVLAVLSLLRPLQLYKQTAIWCSRLVHQIPYIRAWLATSLIIYIAHPDVGALMQFNNTTIAEYKQGLCYWFSTLTCSSSSTPSKLLPTHETGGVYFMLGLAGFAGFLMSLCTVCQTLDGIEYIRTNAKTSTTSSVAKWRQQQAYMIQSSYSEGSTLKRCAINAYLKKNCYIQVLQSVDKQTSTAATKHATHSVSSTGYTIECSVTQADLNSMKADVAWPQNSVLKSLRLLITVLAQSYGERGFILMLVTMVLIMAVLPLVAAALLL